MHATQRLSLAFMTLALAASSARAEDPPFEPKKTGTFEVEALLRQEWTRKLFNNPEPNQDRRRGRLLPKFIAGGDHFQVGVSGDFNYSSDRNTEVTAADGSVTKPTLLRDNY